MSVGAAAAAAAAASTLTGVEPDSISVSVVTNNDDGREVLSTGAVALLGIGLTMGPDSIVGVRFTGLSDLAGADIVSATIQFTSASATIDASTIDVFCQDADNAATFSNVTANIS